MTSQAFLTTEDLAARWRMSPGGIKNLRNSGRPHPKHLKFGFGKNSPVRYPLDEVEKFERENMRGEDV
jgi:hypothetical protein